MLLIASSLYSQKRIKFTYDSAGNQTQRYICITGCTAKMANDSIYKTEKTLVEEDLIEDIEYEQIKYYPNPVLEELYVKWPNTIDKYVSKIELYSLNGQLLKQFDNIKNQNTISVSFYNYPEGYYNLLLIYSNGERKTLKIVKSKN